jgi:hypothetical protein
MRSGDCGILADAGQLQVWCRAPMRLKEFDLDAPELPKLERKRFRDRSFSYPSSET